MKSKTCITGVSDSKSAKVIADTVKGDKNSIVIVSGLKQAEKLAADLSFFCKKKILILGNEEKVFLRFDAKSHEEEQIRIKAVRSIFENEDIVIIAPVSSAVKKMVPQNILKQKIIKINMGDVIDVEDIKERLVNMGYERENMVTSPGMFSVRGSIVDIFSPDADAPYRIEVFGDEIDSMRAYDPDSQRSIKTINNLHIYPAHQMVYEKQAFDRAKNEIKRVYDMQYSHLSSQGNSMAERANTIMQRMNVLIEDIENKSNLSMLEHYMEYFYDEPEYLWDYMADPKIIFDNPLRIKEKIEFIEGERKSDFERLLDEGVVTSNEISLVQIGEELQNEIISHACFFIMPFEGSFPFEAISIDDNRLIKNEGITHYGGRMDLFASDMGRLIEKKYSITIAISSEERRKLIKDFLFLERGLYSVDVVNGELSEGMIFTDDKECYIAESDIFKISKPTRRKRARKKGSTLEAFSDLSKGDLVVHENHGIGKFIDIQTLTVQNVTKDYIKIEYALEDTLYVPVEQMDIVQKYIGSDSGTPKLSRLSSDEWKNTKARAKAAIKDMTNELLKLYAERKSIQGYAFAKDSVWQREFEDKFPYEETDDQLLSIDEIKRDMEKPESMDRLLCGDVGYGKTEVAARAIFKCLTEGKQAAMLVPTTILANQHYETFKARFEDYPMNIEMMSRFKTESEQKEIVDKLRKGKIDFVVGTHRLLSNDIRFRDLGLLVIDEEHRFGVAHKERIKHLKSNVDVIVLSATPIPRTLNMSLTGIKDMSLINEPPHDRYPVQTYVTEQDDSVLREVIRREIDRGGQAFIVYNRIKGINRIADKISKIVPDAKVCVGHGRMNEHALEDVMRGFISGEFNVLVATTIIESGIDIPNANSIIILDADKFGLAQLYQLRGRVGRSNRLAYAYLMYQKDKMLSNVAEKRLKAIKEFTEFGAGFKIAMRDMEIRGAGNLLGAEQSGHMMNIGYELYCKLVDEAVNQSKGVEPETLEIELQVELNVTANIPSWYIADEVTKLTIYKKIANITNSIDAQDVTDELIDRFGDIPKETENLIKVSQIRALSHALRLNTLSERNGKIHVAFSKEHYPKPYEIMMASNLFKSRLRVIAAAESELVLTAKDNDKLNEIISLLNVLIDNKDKTK